ncbi:MAG: hypothetical protein ACTSWX_02415 [Promethearchaeota archaeon]
MKNIKLEFIKFYYTLWNRITHPSPRVIVDIHSGTGIYEHKENNFKIREYDSAILSILKTITLSDRLTIILNEVSEQKFEILQDEIDKIETNGIPIFEFKPKNSYQTNLLNSRKKKIRKNTKRIFPEKIGQKPPSGYSRVYKKTKAKIICMNYNIEEQIDEIFDLYFKDITITKKDNTKKTLKVKGIFLFESNSLDDWNLVRIIGEKAKNNDLIDLIFITSKSILENNLKANINQLKNFYKEVKILKSPHSQENWLDFLLFCSNNPIAISLAENRIKNLKEKIKFIDIREFLKNY